MYYNLHVIPQTVNGVGHILSGRRHAEAQTKKYPSRLISSKINKKYIFGVHFDNDPYYNLKSTTEATMSNCAYLIFMS